MEQQIYSIMKTVKAPVRYKAYEYTETKLESLHSFKVGFIL